MEAAEKEIYRYLKTHAPCTLKKLITSLCIDPLIIFHSLCTLFEKDKITRLDFSIDGKPDPDFSRKYTVKKKA